MVSASVWASIGDHGVLNAQLPAGVSDLWIDRDLSWLDFNERVLAEAVDERTPLLERVKFLAIFTSNLDEFFMKRVSVLRQGHTEAERALMRSSGTPSSGRSAGSPTATAGTSFPGWPSTALVCAAGPS
jgi:Polyphosphate kinase